MILDYNVDISERVLEIRKARYGAAREDILAFLASGASNAEIDLENYNYRTVYGRYRRTVSRFRFSDRVDVISCGTRVFLIRKETNDA